MQTVTIPTIPRGNDPEAWAQYNQIISESLPLRTISPSAIKCFLQDQQLFFKRYIRYEWDEETPLVMIAGSAMHKAFEENNRSLIDGKGSLSYDELCVIAENYFTAEIESGKAKVGEKDDIVKILEKVFFCIHEYSSRPTLDIPLMAEAKHDFMFNDSDGNPMPIPLKCVMDFIGTMPGVEEGEDGMLIVKDYKKVSSFGTDTEDVRQHLIQMWAYYHACFAITGQYPSKFVIEEYKDSKTTCGLQVGELKQLLVDNDVEVDKKAKKDDLIAICCEKGLIEAPLQIKRTEFEYTEGRMRIGDELYKRVVQQILISTVSDNLFLPNPMGWDLAG